MDENVLFMPGLFNDTLRLLLEAHEYFDIHGRKEQENIKMQYRGVYSCEMSRITVRLSSIMAWLMVQKAVHAGKISPHEASTSFKLDSQDVCLFKNQEAQTILPSYMSYLLEETFILYQRVKRLDDNRNRTK